MNLRDIIFSFFTGFVVQSINSYLIVAAIYLTVWVWGKTVFQSRKIQERKRVNLQQIITEMKNAVFTFAMGSLTAIFVFYAHDKGYTRITSDASSIGWVFIVLTFLGMVVLNDLWFYSWHRFLHTPWFFRKIHSIHHKSIDVNPFTMHSFHPLEAFILSCWVIPFVFIVPTYQPVIILLQIVGFVENLISHLGYEFYPGWFNRIYPFKWLTTSTYHNVHHTHFTGNYALHFRWWDKLLGTEVPEYEFIFASLPRQSNKKSE